MVIGGLTDILDILSSQGLFLAYVVLFLLKCFEGPVVSYFAAFAASLGYFNIWIIFILSVLGGVIPDTLLFLLGSSLRGKKVERFVSYFGLSEKRIKWLEENIHKHSIKTIFVVKHVPPLPVPGILLFGFMKMDFLKFFIVSTILNVFGSILFVVLGYYSGIFTANILEYLKLGNFLVPVLVLFIIAVYFLSKYFYRHLADFLKNKNKAVK